MTDDLKYQIGITLIKGVGNALAKNLIAYVGSAEGVFKEKRQTLAKIPGIGEMLSKEIAEQQILQHAEEELAFIEKYRLATYYYLDKNYPYRLKECPDAPVLLFSSNEINLNDGRFVGVVGTRNVSETGKENCAKLVANLANSLDNIMIISGLAYGVDIQAHKAALENDIPTIAVLGHGLDRIYPPIHKSIAVKMCEKGALLTEYLSKTKPDKPNFVQRNRIIAGLCDAVVVVESRKKGGSLITARVANDYNRDVFAFPGRVTDELSAGCNNLIKNNQAVLIENAADILNFMSWEEKTAKKQSKLPAQTTMFVDLNEDEQEIVCILRCASEGLQINELIEKTRLPFSRVSSLLLTMEFNGWVKCLPGNMYKIM